MVNVYIKNVDEEAYRKARKMAIDRGETMGDLISNAIRTLAKSGPKKGNAVDTTFGMLGKLGKKDLDAERIRFRKIREELGKSMDERIERHAGA